MKRLVAIIALLACTAACGSGSNRSFCDHGNRVYPEAKAAVRDPSCPT